MVIFLVLLPVVFIFFNSHFARVPNLVDDFNIRNKVLIANRLKQNNTYQNLGKRFQNFIDNTLYTVGLETRLLQGLPEFQFYGLMATWCINSEN